MAKESFGQRLQRLRQAAGLSQSQLAQAAGVSFGTLRNWEYDRREPLLGAAVKLAMALGVTVGAIAGVEPVKAKPHRKRGNRP
jgi:transcriptional regulator with XRE-family HTH domain